MNIDSIFPSRFVKGGDFAGKRPVVTIRAVTIEEMGKDKERNPVVWFNGTDKGMVLNKTNGMIISGLYGKETDDWKGKKIQLYTVQERHFGDTHDVIKVVNGIPADAVPKVEPEKTVMSTPQVKPNEAHRNYLKKIVELSTRHDSLFEESSDLTELVMLMREWDADGEEEMPTTPKPGKAESMYSFLLGKIEDAVEMADMGEPVLSYLLGRIVTGGTPPNIKCQPLLTSLMNGDDHKDALIACAFIINEQVEQP